MSQTAHDHRPTNQGTPARWLRPTQVRALTAAVLTTSLTLGGVFLAVDPLHSTPGDFLDHPADPIGDEEAEAQVIGAAREIVDVAQLDTSSAGYSLMSCKNRYDPPYQGAVYLTFALPAGARSFSYFPAIVRALVARGWAEGQPANDHALGTTLSKDAITAVIYRQDENPGVGIVRVYGQCRNVNDHTSDTTAWTDVTDRFAKRS